MKIPLIENVKNEEVYQRINERKTIYKTIRERRNKLIEHIMTHNEWITTIIKGKAGRGRPWISFMKHIIENIEKTNDIKLIITVMDRDE